MRLYSILPDEVPALAASAQAACEDPPAWLESMCPACRKSEKGSCRTLVTRGGMPDRKSTRHKKNSRRYAVKEIGRARTQELHPDTLQGEQPQRRVLELLISQDSLLVY